MIRSKVIVGLWQRKGPEQIFGSLPFWRSAILRQPSCDVVQASLTERRLVWLPAPGRWSFRADPFGIWREGRLYVFVERFDYSDRQGHIEVLTYSANLDLLSIDLALREPWHLSYPYVFSVGGDFWMLPEASQSGRLTLYRATAFPIGWKAELTVPLANGALDATPLFWNGKWWLFYCIRQPGPERANELHIAFTDEFHGRWRFHPMNPVRTGRSNARPGGSPIIGDGFIDLPVQDSRTTYGGALRRLRMTLLDEARFEAHDEDWLKAPSDFAPYSDGLHTVSSAGDVSLVDFKRVDRSLAARLVDVRTSVGWFASGR